MTFLLFCPFKNCIFQIYTFWNSTYVHQIAADSEGAGLWWGGAENSYSSHLSGKGSSIEPSDLANYCDPLSEA